MVRLATAAAVMMIACAGVPRKVDPDGSARAPVPVAMDPRAALGAWRSSFGLLILEQSPHGTIVGRWSFTREGQQHVGSFEGRLDGNVLRFAWRSPTPERLLVGEGWIAFDAGGQRFRGEWWTPPFERHEKIGNGRGWYERGQRLTGRVTGTRQAAPDGKLSWGGGVVLIR